MIAPNEALPLLAPARPEQLAQLMALNEFWLRENHAQDTTKGFVGGRIDAAAFSWMIEEKLITAATDAGGELAGYFLSYNRPDLPILQLHQALVQQLVAKGRLVQPGDRVALGIQSALSPDWQGKGLIVPLRQAFLRQVAGRFEWLFTTIARENTRSLQSSLRFGWQPVGDDPHYHHLLLAVPPNQ